MLGNTTTDVIVLDLSVILMYRRLLQYLLISSLFLWMQAGKSASLMDVGYTIIYRQRRFADLLRIVQLLAIVRRIFMVQTAFTAQ